MKIITSILDLLKAKEQSEPCPAVSLYAGLRKHKGFLIFSMMAMQEIAELDEFLSSSNSECGTMKEMARFVEHQLDLREFFEFIRKNMPHFVGVEFEKNGKISSVHYNYYFLMYMDHVRKNTPATVAVSLTNQQA